MSALRSWPELTGLTLVCTLLATVWVYVVPPFESPDEPAHWGSVVFLTRHGQLPATVDPDSPAWTPRLYESHQPPLFYTLAAVLLRTHDIVPENPELQRNRRFRTAHNQPHLFVRPPGIASGETAPAGLRAVRLLSAACGVATVPLTYVLGLTVFAGRRPHALAAAALVGLTPQFLFIAGAVNNDALATMLATASLLVAFRLRRQEAVSGRQGLLLGLLLGAAGLSKLTALAVAPVVSGIVLWDSLRTRPRWWPPLAGFGLGLGTTFGAYVTHNTWRWRDPLLTDLAAENTPDLVDRKSLAADYWREVFLPRLFESYWGYFGWFSVPLPVDLYRGLALAMILAAAGQVLGKNRHRTTDIILLGLVVVTSIGAVVHYNLTYSQAQGRFLFPAIAPIAVLLVAGWWGLVERLTSRASEAYLTVMVPRLFAGGITMGMLLLHLAALWQVLSAYSS